MTSTSSRAPNWPLVFLAIIGLVIASPFIFAFFIAGLALTIGLAGTLIKVSLLVLAVWAVVTLFKGLFGTRRPSRLPPQVTRVETALRVDPEAEYERERRESMAALDKELDLAIARKKGGSAP